MSIIVFSKDGCPACTRVKHLLRNRKLAFTERKIGEEVSKEEAEAEIGKRISSVPQVIIDGTHIGGFEHTRTHFEKQDASNVTGK